MFQKSGSLLLIVPLLGCSGAVDTTDEALPQAIESVLGSSHATEFFSINPEYVERLPAERSFHGWGILGRAEIDSSTSGQLIDALRVGVATLSPNEGTPACFNPRHALRLSGENTIVDLLICFECRQVYVYDSGERVGGFGVSDQPGDFFEEVARANNLKLPPPANSQVRSEPRYGKSKHESRGAELLK